MGFFTKDKGSIDSEYFKLETDVAGLKSGFMVNVVLLDDYVEFKTKPCSVKLKYDQITDVYYGVKSEIVDKNKSVIGRAVVGGFLFGGVGAIVGAVSGGGTKKKTDRKLVFVISYISSDGEDAFIAFEDTRMYHGRRVANKLKELARIEERAKTVPEFL